MLGDFLDQLHQLLELKNQRLIVECVGEAVFAEAVFSELTKYKSNQKTLVVSSSASLKNATPFNKTQQLLGQEFDLLWFDAEQGFAVDAFLRVVSVLKSPGILLLSHPANQRWLSEPDSTAKWQNNKTGNGFFLPYLITQLTKSPAVIRLQQGKPVPVLPELTVSSSALPAAHTRTQQQQDVWQALLQFVTDNQYLYCALLAKRGRGKSTLLGQLLSEKEISNYQFVLISQAKAATQNCLKYVKSAKNTIYKAIDEFLENPIECDCIVVDEAATIPIAQLQALAKFKIKTIYTTTLDGYEGTGSGFELQFLNKLNYENILRLELTQPMRWGQKDVLEQSLNDMFLMDEIETVATQECSQTSIISYSQEQLSADKSLLKQVFQLLKSSHYRTQASDLKSLLDNPDLKLYLAQNKQQVIGVATTVDEGGLELDLCKDIAFGIRRPQGHLLAQTITAQSRVENFATFKGRRIQRIAVLKDCRQQGIGTLLIEAIEQDAKQQNLDYLGASFALNEQHLPFWRAMQFELVHLGVGQGTTTGLPSAVFLKALQAQVHEVQSLLVSQLQQEMPFRLLTQYKELDPVLVYALLKVLPPLGENNLEACEPYLKGYKGFEYALTDLRVLSFYLLQNKALLTADAALLIQAVLQYQNPQKLVRQYGFTGKKQLHQNIKSVFSVLKGV